MRVVIADDELRRLYEEPTFHSPRLGSDVVKAFRKKVGLLFAATSEQDLRAMKSLRYEKLTGDRSGQRSIRLNDRWRLILRLDADDAGSLLIVIEIVDYH